MLNKSAMPALACAFVWGTTFCVASEALTTLSPVWLMFLRFVQAYAILWALCHEWRPLRFSRQEALFFLLGVAGGSGYFLLEYEALKTASSADVGVIISSVPLITLGMLGALGLERVTWRHALCMTLGTAGVAIITYSGGAQAGGSLKGHILAILAAVAWAIYSVLLVLIGKRHSPLFVARRLFFWALVTMSPSLCAEPIPDFQTLTPHTIAGVIYLGCVASALCVWLWGLSTVSIGAERTNAFLLLMPVVALCASPADVTPHTAAGAAIVIAALAWNEFLKRQNNP